MTTLLTFGCAFLESEWKIYENKQCAPKSLECQYGASLMSFGLIDSDVMVGSSLVAIRLSEALASRAS